MSFASSPAVEGLVNFFKLLIGDVGIDLGSRNRGVAQHRLDAPDVSAVNEQISGKAVAESVGMDFFDDAGLGGIVFDDSLDAAGSKTKAFLRRKLAGVSRDADKKSRINVCSGFQIFF